MSTFTGGSLKLKGDKDGVKKQKKSKHIAKPAPSAPAADAVNSGKDEAAVPPAASKTKAQQQQEEYVAKREEERLSKLAAKSHRERVQEYNEKLAALSEHHDIPKVGPG